MKKEEESGVLTNNGDKVNDGGSEVEGNMVCPLNDGDSVVFLLLVQREATGEHEKGVGICV